MKTFIVLVTVHSDEIDNPRGICESIENMVFSIPTFPDDYTTALKIRDILLKEKNITEKDDVLVFPISDFMDMVNNEEFNPDHFFMSYVKA